MLVIFNWIRGSESVPAIDGRELHKALGVGRDLSTWINNRIQAYGYEEGQDFTSYLVPRGSGTPAREYTLLLQTGAELSLLERSEKGRLLRRFILDQKPVQNCNCSSGNCTGSEKPMWEVTREELQAGTLKACRKCKTPFQGAGELCPGCVSFDADRTAKRELVQQRNAPTVTNNPLVVCNIEREGNTTMTVGSFGTVYTFKRNALGHAVASISNPLHREQVLKSIFYQSYEPEVM